MSDTQSLKNYQPVNLQQKFTLFSEQWSQRIVAQLNDYQVKLAKVQGDFIWHQHEETDEFFMVIEGELRIDFREGHVVLRAGELYVIPKGVEHKPFAENEVKILLIKPCGTVNTGDAGGDYTMQEEIWV
ncbi:MAG: cupin domain-containing protein [Enterobacteriaceae bacterium]